MSANWSRDDCLNHVAGGQVVFDIDCKYELLQIQTQNVMNILVLQHSWMLNMKDGTTFILAGLQQQMDNWRLVTYLQDRDMFRAALTIPRPPR